MDSLEQEINQFINSQLLSTKGLSKEVIKEADQRNLFLDRLFLRRYRKYATTQAVRDFVQERLNGIIDNKLPMRFVPSFGGYKHWWCPTYPKTDWAEVFNVKYLLEYIAPISNSYRVNEVCITYESEEVILSELNNIPQKGLDEYTDSFREVLRAFQDIIDQNPRYSENTILPTPQLSLVLAREQYDEVGFTKEDLLKRIQEMMPDYYARFDSYDEDDKLRRLKKVQTNFKLNGVIDYSNASSDEIAALYKHSRVLNEAFLDADYEIRGESWPHIGSSSSSMVDFWAGMGIIEKRTNGALVPRIISHSQYEIIKDSLVYVPVVSKLTGENKNYDSIGVYIGTLVF